MVATSGEGSMLYKNIADQSYVQEREVMGKEYLIQEKSEPFEWELSGETKKVGNYTAQKASFTKIVDSKRFSTGMTEMENVKDTLQVTVWFTPEIPVSHGPENYFGLPGLILEVKNLGRTLICEKIELNPSAEPVVIEREVPAPTPPVVEERVFNTASELQPWCRQEAEAHFVGEHGACGECEVESGTRR